MAPYSLVELLTNILLLIGKQALKRCDPGRVHDDGPAQPPFPIALLAGQDMSLAGFLAHELARARPMKPLTRAAV
jgi:hypothetical protein